MDKTLDHLYGRVDQRRQVGFLVLIKTAEYIIDLPAFWEIIPDAKAKAGITLTAAEGLNAFQPIVTGTTAFRFQPDFPEGGARSSTITNTFSRGMRSSCIQ